MEFLDSASTILSSIPALIKLHVRGAGQCFGVTVRFVYRAYEQKSPVWDGVLAFLQNQLDTCLCIVPTSFTTLYKFTPTADKHLF
ncbi:hypothetical protein V1506DRAFT_534350 [Lipomyces tetrasporus]